MEEKQRQAILKRFAKAGVKFLCCDGVVISAQTEIEPDAVIKPGTVIEENSYICPGAKLGPNTHIIGCRVGVMSDVAFSRCEHSTVGEGDIIGPYALVCAGCTLGANVRVGSFCKVRNCVLSDNAVLGDAVILTDTDVGGGAVVGSGVTVTFAADGPKGRVQIGAGARIGAGCIIVAPCNIGANIRVEPGRVITGNVAGGAVPTE